MLGYTSITYFASYEHKIHNPATDFSYRLRANLPAILWSLSLRTGRRKNLQPYIFTQHENNTEYFHLRYSLYRDGLYNVDTSILEPIKAT